MAYRLKDYLYNDKPHKGTEQIPWIGCINFCMSAWLKYRKSKEAGTKTQSRTI